MQYKQLSLAFFSVSIMLVIIVQLGFFDTIDLIIYEWTQSISNSGIDSIWRMFTLVGETEVLAVLSIVIILFLLWRRKFLEAIFYLFLMVFGIVMTFSLKVIFQRERPEGIEYVDFLGFGQEIISYSFPSGHAVKSLLLLGFIFRLVHRSRYPNKLTTLIKYFLVLAIAMCGVGQVFLQEHFLSDCLGGFIIGITILFFSLWLYSLWECRTNRSELTLEKDGVEKISN